jgi:adenylate cyclase
MEIYKFRNCFLHTGERSVIKDRQHLDLTTKTFDVLQFLIENRGKVVTKDEILGSVWNGSIVEESNLPVHISKLRRLLGETRDSRFIETVQGTGYRFVSPVETVGEDKWIKKIERGLGDVRSGAERTWPHSIAVLPLQNESGDPNIEYLTDGLTESLINSLSHIPGLKVIARNTVFRYKSKDIDVRDVGEALGVSTVLTGRARVVGDDLIVGVELTSAEDGAQIWGEHYHRKYSDLIALADEVSFAVAENLESTKVRNRFVFANSLTRDPESFRLYLKGRYFLEKHSANDMYKAIEFFYKSVALDPDNIHSYAEIVECYRALYTYDYISYVEFLEVTKPVLAIVANANQSFDFVQIMHCDLKVLAWEFDEAARYCRRALALNPNSLKGRLRYSDLLLQARNFTKALEQLEKIMIIDPLSVLIYKRIGRLFYMMGKYENAIAYLDDALDLEPASHEALALRGAAYAETGNYKESLRDLQESLRSEHHTETLTSIGMVYAKQGKAAKAYQILERVEAESKGHRGNSMMLAYVYLSLGETNKTYDVLEQAYARHDPDLRALTYDCRWNELRTDARFKSLVRRVGLPDLSN